MRPVKGAAEPDIQSLLSSVFPVMQKCSSFMLFLNLPCFMSPWPHPFHPWQWPASSEEPESLVKYHSLTLGCWYESPRKLYEHSPLKPCCHLNLPPIQVTSLTAILPSSLLTPNPGFVWVASVQPWDRMNHDWDKSVSPCCYLWQWLVSGVGMWPSLSQWDIRQILMGAYGNDFPLGHKGRIASFP